MQCAYCESREQTNKVYVLVSHECGPLWHEKSAWKASLTPKRGRRLVDPHGSPPQHGRRLLLTAGSVPVGIFASWYGAFAMLGKKIQVAARKYDPSEFRVGALEDPGPIGCQALVHRH